MPTDKRSFILGMVTAFCECVAGGCKKLARSPPMTDADFALSGREACEIIEKHGLLWYHERHADVPEEKRYHTLLIASRQETIDRYMEIRKEHLLPDGLEPFQEILSYDPERRVSTGYDAYRAYFPKGE